VPGVRLSSLVESAPDAPRLGHIALAFWLIAVVSGSVGCGEDDIRDGGGIYRPPPEAPKAATSYVELFDILDEKGLHPFEGVELNQGFFAVHGRVVTTDLGTSRSTNTWTQPRWKRTRRRFRTTG